MADNVSYPPAPPAPVTPHPAAPPEPAPVEPPAPAPRPPAPASVASADNEVRKTLRGTLLGSLLEDDQEPPPAPGAPAAPTPSDGAQPQAQAPAAPAPAQGAAPVPDPPKKPTKPKLSRAPQAAAPVDVAQIATAAASAAVQAQRQLQQEEEARRRVGDIPQEVVKYAQVYDELHRSNPSKYPADLTLRMARFVMAERQRAAEWEQSHPGEGYDSDDDQHADWYKANQPNIDEEDFSDARVSVKAREIVAKEVAPRTEKLQRDVERQNLEPKLVATARTLAGPILKAVVPEFDGELNKAAIDKLKEQDPIALEVAAEVDGAYAQVVYDAGLLWHGASPFEDSNQSHATARQILSQFESELAELKPRELARGGKQWASLTAFNQMSPQDRARHYVVEYQDFVNYVRDRVAPQEASRIYDERLNQGKSLVEKLAGKFGYKRDTTPVVAASPEPQHARPTTTVASPAIGSGTPPSPQGAASESANGDSEQEFFKRMNGR